MHRLCYALAIALAAVPAACFAQQTMLDEVSQQASQLESELSKYKENTPEAAALQLQLIDLYHAHARPFGLIRVGQKFVNEHAAHPRHAEAMLKLIDALQAVSRNKDVVAVARQFLVRYPEHAACPQVEVTLAETTEQLNDAARTAETYEAVWRRQPAAPTGRQAAVKAIYYYGVVNTAEAFARAATLAEAVLDQAPADEGEWSSHIGWQAVYYFHRADQWNRSNQAAQKMLQRGLPANRQSLRELYAYMAENYLRLDQRTNAVESFRKAREIRESAYYHERMIAELYSAGAKGADLEGLVNEYFQKYPQRPERFAMKGYLALAYLRDQNHDRGIALIREVLPFDGRSHWLSTTLVQNHGSDPAKLAECEQIILDALNRNPADGFYYRWTLAFELYRDRMNDLPKARQMVRELLLKSPTNDGHVWAAISWLLYNASSDAEFAADLELVAKVRRERMEWPYLRDCLPNWAKQAAQNKDLQARAELARQKVQQGDADPLLQEWLASESENRAVMEQARIRLLSPGTVEKLTDSQAKVQFDALISYYLNYGTAEHRARAVNYYQQYIARFPRDYHIAVWALYYASHYGNDQQNKQMAEHLLTFTEPQRHDYNYDAYYRMMAVAARAKDVELAKRVFAWILASQEKLNPGAWDNRYSDSIGDYLAGLQLENEAREIWRRGLHADYNSYYSRSCAERLLRDLQGDARRAFLQELISRQSDYHGTYAMWLAADYLQAGDLQNFQKTLLDSQEVQRRRPFRVWGIEDYPVWQWISKFRDEAKASEADKRLVFKLIRDLNLGRPSAAAALALLELPDEDNLAPMQRLLAWQRATRLVGNDSHDWDWLIGFAQAAMGRKDYAAVAALVSGMLENITNVEPTRLKTGRDLVAQSYARMGAVGLSLDDNSPLAPLMRAALYLRLGDKRLAFDTYAANMALFDKHRDEVPLDLILFVCESHMAAGGDENHERVEDILRNWLIKFSEAKDLEDASKASVQLLLARNYFKAQRYDVARGEFLTVKNRYPNAPQAVEAEFGVGECYMAQKVYDQAESVFDALAASRQRDVAVRAQFLRGVLASRRGDKDEARDIFRRVLELIPPIDLANETLYNLAEIYGAEERFIDQLELLRTVGRLGQRSKRWHHPGQPLSIVVYDPDLAVSRGKNRIPVRVTATGGDEVVIYLYPSPGGKGLFRADLDTRLGQPDKSDKVLQLTGADVIHCDYPEEFKAEFRSVPLSDAEIRLAANARLFMASSKIVDEQQETLTQRLEREARAREQNQVRALVRPKDQIKPGNPIYLRVQDADRDLTHDVDRVPLRLSASSGDQVRVMLTETGPHTGVFEGTVATGELPAGALASDTSINHNPLMAIDSSPDTAWVSEPNGATPKWLAVDMKDLRSVDRVTIHSPNPRSQAPVRGSLLASRDGRFFFRIASVPADVPPPALPAEYGPMLRRVFAGDFNGYTTWQQVVDLCKNTKPLEEEATSELSWKLPETAEGAKQAHAVLWQGKFVQPRPGAVRFAVQANRAAIVIDGRLELPLGPGDRGVDVWLDRGTHDLAIFAATYNPVQGVAALRAREDLSAAQVVLAPFRGSDFDLQAPDARPARVRPQAKVRADNGVWDFRFEAHDIRHVKLLVEEYLGEAVAINHLEISGEDGQEQHIPAKADVLSLANNEVLEMASGDVVSAAYTDEFTQTSAGGSQLLTATLTATYYNASITPINHDLVRQPDGAIYEIRKQVVRIDPGEKFVVEIVDYDHDQTAGLDTLKFQVQVNDGEVIELEAQETQPDSGIFTKEVLTSDKPREGRLVVKSGDRVYCTYLDAQNTFPGHAVPREAVVYVNEPSIGRIRVIETRVVRPEAEGAAPHPVYLPADPKAPPGKAASVAFEVPLTVEVFDRDAAKDSRSKITVKLLTTDGAQVDLQCVVSSAFSDLPANSQSGLDWALEEGRFVGQVILQLGGRNSPSLVPLSAEMPRDLVGGPKLSAEEETQAGSKLSTRVLNLSGKDIVTAAYVDERRPKEQAAKLTAKARLVANGVLACTDRDYEQKVAQLHVGERLYLRVADADLDASDERDTAEVEITSPRGEREVVRLQETLAHSGLFTGSVALRPAESPTAGNLKREDPAIETFFGDQLTLKYHDKAASTETGELTFTLEIPVVVGTDGLVAAFSKTFNNEKLAVETQFHIAESYFELFKSHVKLGRLDEQKESLESGRRVLREVMEDYPDPKYAPRIAYLLGQFSQELKQWDEAIESYRLIVRQYPDHTLAADAQYKMAQCYEEAKEFDQALEAYVTLAATYPKSPLIASVMIRISDYFYKDKNYDVAAQVGEKFLERFDGHEYAARMAFRVGQCYYKAEQYAKAAAAFDRFAKIFPDEELAPDAMFWAGESFRTGGNNADAFRRYNMCRWKYPASEAAKYARGRLALPEMIQQFESEAQSVEDSP